MTKEENMYQIKTALAEKYGRWASLAKSKTKERHFLQKQKRYLLQAQQYAPSK